MKEPKQPDPLAPFLDRKAFFFFFFFLPAISFSHMLAAFRSVHTMTIPDADTRSRSPRRPQLQDTRRSELANLVLVAVEFRVFQRCPKLALVLHKLLGRRHCTSSVGNTGSDPSTGSCPPRLFPMSRPNLV